MSRTMITDTCCDIGPRHLSETDKKKQPSDKRLFRWKSPELNTLPLEAGSFVESKIVTFEGSIWQIRTYPNGLSENENYGSICLVLRRTGSHAPRYHGRLSWKFGVQRSYRHRVIMKERTSQRNDLKFGPIELLKLSDACNVENNLLSGSKITMFCEIMYDEEKREAIPEIPRAISSILEDQRIAGTSFGKTKANSVLEISWKFSDFTEMPMTVDHSLTSRECRFEDRTYSIRLYPNGQSENETDERICLLLMISEHTDFVKRVMCKIGLKCNSCEISEEHGLEESDMLLGPIILWPRCDVESTIEVFCTIRTEKTGIL